MGAQSRLKSSRRILFGTSALLFICATLNVSASLRQEIEAFILVPPNPPPSFSSLYYLNYATPMAAMKTSTYTIAVGLPHAHVFIVLNGEIGRF